MYLVILRLTWPFPGQNDHEVSDSWRETPNSGHSRYLRTVSPNCVSVEGRTGPERFPESLAKVRRPTGPTGKQPDFPEKQLQPHAEDRSPLLDEVADKYIYQAQEANLSFEAAVLQSP